MEYMKNNNYELIKNGEKIEWEDVSDLSIDDLINNGYQAKLDGEFVDIWKVKELIKYISEKADYQKDMECVDLVVNKCELTTLVYKVNVKCKKRIQKRIDFLDKKILNCQEILKTNGGIDNFFRTNGNKQTSNVYNIMLDNHQVEKIDPTICMINVAKRYDISIVLSAPDKKDEANKMYRRLKKSCSDYIVILASDEGDLELNKCIQENKVFIYILLDNETIVNNFKNIVKKNKKITNKICIFNDDIVIGADKKGSECHNPRINIRNLLSNKVESLYSISITVTLKSNYISKINTYDGLLEDNTQHTIKKWWNENTIIGKTLRHVYEAGDSGVEKNVLKYYMKEVFGSINASFYYTELVRTDKGYYQYIYTRSNNITYLTNPAREYIKFLIAQSTNTY